MPNRQSLPVSCIRGDPEVVVIDAPNDSERGKIPIKEWATFHLHALTLDSEPVSTPIVNPRNLVEIEVPSSDMGAYATKLAPECGAVRECGHDDR